MFATSEDLKRAVAEYRKSGACERGQHWWQRICDIPWKCVACGMTHEQYANELARKERRP